MNVPIRLSLVTGNDKPQVDTSKIFNGVIGQSGVVNQMKFYLSCNEKSLSIPTFLYTGSHGLGKTFIASKMAEAMNRRFIVLNAKTLDTSKQFVEDFLLNTNCVIGVDPITILIDEAHAITKDIATVLLSFLNPTSECVNHYQYKDFVIEYDMRKINVIFATTDAFAMCGPLRNRCEMVYFDAYANHDLIDILHLYLPKGVVFDCDQEQLAFACRGRARDAFQLAKKVERYLAMHNTDVLTDNGWNELKNIFGIQHCGLTAVERKLLEYVGEHQPVSCSSLAMAFMVKEENVKHEIEVRPRELGLIDTTPRGRILTPAGEKYVNEKE